MINMVTRGGQASHPWRRARSNTINEKWASGCLGMGRFLPAQDCFLKDYLLNGRLRFKRHSIWLEKKSIFWICDSRRFKQSLSPAQNRLSFESETPIQNIVFQETRLGNKDGWWSLTRQLFRTKSVMGRLWDDRFGHLGYLPKCYGVQDARYTSNSSNG